MECLSSRREPEAPGGGRAKIENSSRPHPRKFGLKRFLAVEEAPGGEVGKPVFGLPPWKKYRRRDRAHLVPPDVGWMQQSPAVRRRAILPVGSTGGIRHQNGPTSFRPS